MPIAFLRFEVSFIFRKSGKAVGVITTHSGEILGCGEPSLFQKVREFPERRFGNLKAREGFCVHGGMELAKEKGLSATMTQGDFSQNLKLSPTSPPLRAGRITPHGASASWVSCLWLPRYLDQISVRVWRGLRRGSTRSVGVMYIVLMCWFGRRRSGDRRHC